MTETTQRSTGTATLPTLYERLGGADGLRRIIDDVIDAHLANPLIGVRFQAFEPAEMKQKAFTFFAAGTGGPQSYEGRDLPTAHKGMNINEQEFLAATDDLMSVLAKHGVGQIEQQEVLAAFYSMKGEVLRL